jgi:hypothetical protein
MYYICGLWPLRNTKLFIPNMVLEPRSRASTARCNSCFDLKFSFGSSLICLFAAAAGLCNVSGHRCPLLRLRPPPSLPLSAAVSSPPHSAAAVSSPPRFDLPRPHSARSPQATPFLGRHLCRPSPAAASLFWPPPVFLLNRLPALAGRHHSLPGSTTQGIVNL